jgi:hypothetical protein
MALSIVRTSTPGFAFATTRAQTITAPAVGNSLIATIEHQTTGTLTVTDNIGNTWTRRLGSENGATAATGQFKVDIWDLIGITSGHAPTTITLSDTGSASVLAITVIEVAGALTYASAAANTISSTAAGSSPQPAITAAIGDLVVTSLSYYCATQVGTVASPYTLVVGSGTSTTRYDSAYWIATSAGSTSAYFTTTGSSFSPGAVTARYTPVLSNVAPTASFTTSISNLVVSVDASGSTDSDGTIVSYDYDWGDSTTHGTTSVTSHTYASAGTYTITLTVTDNSGAPTSTTHSVTVTAPSTFAPVRKGHKYNPGPGASNTLITLDPTTPTSGSTISTGDWMIAVVSFVSATSMSPPSGWTTLQSITQAGTLSTTIYGKIRLSGDTSYDFTMDAGGTTTCADLFWGSGGDVVSNWIVGTDGLRATTGTSSTNVAPTATSTIDHSLGILISTERTTATETAITSISGATEWFFDQQANGTTLLQSIEVASIDDKTPAGALGGVTVTYPNTSASNGMARWIIIPPAPSPYPTRIAHVVALNAGGTSDLVLTPDAATVAGDALLVAITTNTATQTLGTPSGWTLLKGPTATGNNTNYAFAKIRAGGETSYNFSTTGGTGAVRGDIMTIRGADVISNWIIGTEGNRVASGGAFVTTAPAITTTSAYNLLLSVFGERSATTATTATFSGATQWFFDTEGSDNITLAAAYALQPTAGTSSAVSATYSVSQATNSWALQLGIPPAPTTPSLAAATMKGYSYDNVSSNNAQVVIGPDGSIATGDWMVAAYTTNGTTTITPPSGWTTLLGLTSAGSGKIALFGKIRASGDTSYTFPVNSGAASSSIILMWGADAAALSNWTTGTTGIRGSSITTNTAPSVTTTVDNSLVLTLSMDRNTTTPTGISSISGATEWFFVGGTALVLQTLEVASTVKSPAGATSAVTVTYPNASANGIGVQIVLPPAAPPSPATPSAPIRFVSDFLATSLRVGAKVEDATTVRLVATPTGGGSAITSTSQTPSYFGWVNCKVTGLTPGTAYDLSLQAGASNTVVATFSAIKTLAPSLSTFSMITSSCQSTGSNPVVFSQIASENPDFFAHQGDIHYEDTGVENVWRTGVDAAMSASYMKAMLATVPMTYHWDNHDWGGNSSYKTSPVATFAPTAIRELLGTDMPDTVGLYSTWVHHGIRFVETDQWALRDDATMTDSSAKSMLGTTQKAWFKATMLAAKEPIIVWLCSFPFYSNNVGNGRWGDFQTEQNELNAWFIAHPGVKSRIVAVGGDSHSICADDGTNSMWHIPSLNASPLAQAGGLASGTWNIANIDVDDTKGYYSKLTFTPSTTKIVFKWEAKQDDGTLMATWSKDFSRTVVSVWDGSAEHDAKPSTWNGTSELPGGIEFAP